MKITVKILEESVLTFKDLEPGEIFTFRCDFKDCKEEIEKYVAIKTDEDSYVGLYDGIIETLFVEENEPVFRVDAELIIKGILPEEKEDK